MGKASLGKCLLIGIRLVPDTDLCSGIPLTASSCERQTSSGYGSINSSLFSEVGPHHHASTYRGKSYASNQSKGNHSQLTSRTAIRSEQPCQRIGVVVCNSNLDQLSLKSFRDLMHKQLSRLPNSFVFLSLGRLPISKQQESLASIKSVLTDDVCIYIRKHFDIPRYGIKSSSGECFGFVFIEPDWTAGEIRIHVRKLLLELDTGQTIRDFRLMDRNGWPLSIEQETSLCGWDLIQSDCIRITDIKCTAGPFVDTDDDCRFDHKLTRRNASTITLPDDFAVSANDDCVNDLVDNSFAVSLLNTSNAVLPASSQSIVKNTYFDWPTVPYLHQHCGCVSEATTDETSFVTSVAMPVSHKPILISYVRKEAEQHARRLKSKLIDLGLEVYLDVDEITVGNDWQDSLNNAVANCEIFVPLITPNYGLTLWTNREIKFADMKKKIIVPINFLSSWPPECLAIQFATTQFLPWKTMEEIEREYAIEGERAFDIRFWDDQFVVRTAQQISRLVKKNSFAREMQNATFSTSLRSLAVTEEEDEEEEEEEKEEEEGKRKAEAAPEEKDTESNEDRKPMDADPPNDRVLSRPISKAIDDISILKASYSAATTMNATKRAISESMPSNETETRPIQQMTYAGSVLSDLPPEIGSSERHSLCGPEMKAVDTINVVASVATEPIKSDKKAHISSDSYHTNRCQSSIELEDRNTFTSTNEKNTNGNSTESNDFDETTDGASSLSDQPLVVISAHPQQKDTVERLKRHLCAKQFQVWSSTEICSINSQPMESIDEPDNHLIRSRSSSFASSAARNEMLRRQLSYVESKDKEKSESGECKSGGKHRTSASSLSSLNLNEQTIQNHLRQATEFVIPEQRSNRSSNREIPSDSLLQIEMEASATIDLNTVITQSSYTPKPKDACARNRHQASWYGCSADHVTSLHPNEIGKVKIFKQKVNEARIVIILLSDAYCRSRTCKRQAFYCDFRKQVLPIQLETISEVPHWASKLMYSPDLILAPGPRSTTTDERFLAGVCSKLCQIIRCEERVNAHVLDEHTRYLATVLERSLALRDRSQLFVYIAGSTKIKRCSNRSLCVKIGQTLAAHPHLVLVTGGSSGVAESIATSFYHERQRLITQRNNETKAAGKIKSDHHDLHDDYSADDRDFSTDVNLDEQVDANDARWRRLQDPNGLLHVLHVLPRSAGNHGIRAPDYGVCVRVGDSLQERDSLIARVFRFCILVEGGAGSAKLAQEFAYNENFVIPVCSSGGAAAGKFIAHEECAQNITEVPPGVAEQDWTLLKARGQSNRLGHVLASIVTQLAEYQANKRCRLMSNEGQAERSNDQHNINNDICKPITIIDSGS